MMDLKSKGMAFVGNIFQKFETICHEMDSMSQNKVKYVDGQVHTVGESMKKLVLDLIPPSPDPVKSEAEAMSPKANTATDSYIRSMVGDEDSHGHTALEKQMPIWVNDFGPALNWLDGAFSEPIELVEPDFAQGKLEDFSTNRTDAVNIDQLASPTLSEPFEEADVGSDTALEDLNNVTSNKSADINQLDNSFCEPYLVDQLASPTSSKLLEEAESGLAPGKWEDFSINNQLGKQSSEPNHVDQLTTMVFSKSLEEAVFDSTSGLLDDLTNIKKSVDRNPLGNSFRNQLTNQNSSKPLKEAEHDLTDRKVDDFLTSRSGSMKTEENATKEDSSEALSATCQNKSFEASSSSEFIYGNGENACDLLAGVSPAISVNHEHFWCPQKVGTDHDFISDASFSVASSERKVVGVELASSVNSLLTEPLTLHPSSFNNILSTYSNPANVAASNSDNFGCLLSSIPAPTVSSGPYVEIILGSSNSVISLESIENGMENIDLSDNVKLEESPVLVDDIMLHEVSRRGHKLGSYKKKLQDAFTGKKRIIKEYEQLAIWYGDIDDHYDSAESVMSSTTTIQINDTHDGEWEIL